MSQFDNYLASLQDTYNENVNDYNSLCDRYEQVVLELMLANERIEKMNADLVEQQRVMVRQREVIDKAVEMKGKDKQDIMLVMAQLKDLQKLNPQRLVKQVKNLQEKNAKLTKDNVILKANSMAADRSVREITKKVKENNQIPFYQDELTGNTIRFVPKTYIAKDNGLHAVPKSPVLEFYHNHKGITRQGVLGLDGLVHWCDARNSMPTPIEQSVATNAILDYCKQHKINTKTKSAA